ncbi:Clavaminate synthase-like protein [Trichoderma austrokoningii]
MFNDPFMQIHLERGPNGFQEVSTVQAQANFYLWENETMVAKLMRLCPPRLWPHESYNNSCPRPILVNLRHESMLNKLNTALTLSLTDIVDRWWSDKAARFPERMPLEFIEEALLKHLSRQSAKGAMPPYTERKGSWRPDFLIEDIPSADGTVQENFRITEINARFSFNAYMHAVFGHTALEETGMARYGLLPATTPEKVIDGLFTLFRKDRPLHLLKGKEPGVDIAMFVEAVRRRTGLTPRVISPSDLRLVIHEKVKPGYMLCAIAKKPTCHAAPSTASPIYHTEDGEHVEQIFQVGLELHQDELAALPLVILQELSKLCFNDLRTIFLVHDKRMLGIIKEELQGQVARGVLTQEQSVILDHGIADTYLPGSPEMHTILANSKENPEIRKHFLLKAIRGGKGEQISFGDEMTGEEWVAALQRQVTPGNALGDFCVLQRRIIPRRQAQEPAHVRTVSEMLRQHGILKITLGFDDVKSRYLEQLLLSLHQHHGHQLPIAHSATKGWFWDVLPTTTSFQTANCQARSETMDEFPWHTDCSYENPPPRYFALHVLQPDRYGGGTLSVLNVQRLSELLSATTKASLARPEYLIRTPPEFEKSPRQQHIVGSIMETDADNQTQIMRFREDILTPLSKRASAALNELKHAVQSAEARSHSTLHLTPKALPARSIILLDNRRWLHARNHITDPGRHLRRPIRIGIVLCRMSQAETESSAVGFMAPIFDQSSRCFPVIAKHCRQAI